MKTYAIVTTLLAQAAAQALAARLVGGTAAVVDATGRTLVSLGPIQARAEGSAAITGDLTAIVAESGTPADLVLRDATGASLLSYQVGTDLTIDGPRELVRGGVYTQASIRIPTDG